MRRAAILIRESLLAVLFLTGPAYAVPLLQVLQ